jgi:predicted O-methyltransferase YrrM
MSSPHRHTLSTMVKAFGWTRGAELGVDKGILFERLLTDHPDLHLIGVDVFPVEHRRQRCQSIQAQFSGRSELLIMTCTEAAASVPDQSLDFVFIDADHSHEAVTEDIAHWTPKVKRGGWVGGHDYNLHFPGVISAVNKAFDGVRVYQPGSIWGVWV